MKMSALSVRTEARNFFPSYTSRPSHPKVKYSWGKSSFKIPLTLSVPVSYRFQPSKFLTILSERRFIFFYVFHPTFLVVFSGRAVPYNLPKLVWKGKDTLLSFFSFFFFQYMVDTQYNTGFRLTTQSITTQSIGNYRCY